MTLALTCVVGCLVVINCCFVLILDASAEDRHRQLLKKLGLEP